MARFNEILAPRFNRFLTKMLSMKGGAPAPQLSGDIIPTLPLEEISVESRFHAGWNRYAVGITVNAVGAQNNAVQIRNPRGSNVVAVLEDISYSIGGGGNGLEVDLEGIVGTSAAQDVDLGVVNQGIPLDARNASAGAVCQISSANNVALSAATVERWIASSSTMGYVIRTKDQQIQVLPGTIYRVVQVTVNLPIFVNFLWRERFLEESERGN
jgi:hypothetical protein